MALFLRILEGLRAGEQFELSPGLIIGRDGADISLSDPKVSSRHAVVEDSPEGLVLKDNESKNGIYLLGRKVKKIPLLAGTEIKIGSSILVVFERASRPEPAAAFPAVPKVAPVESAPEEVPQAPAPAPPPRLTWSQILERFVLEAADQVQDRPRRLIPLASALNLTFVRGIQSQTTWTLGYGPRRVGSACHDLPIYEEGAPDLCFELFPTPDGLHFRTPHPEVIKINGLSQGTCILKNGDLISILNTEIAVEFFTP